MTEYRYYTVQHLKRYESGMTIWFESNPQYYGIDRSNYCHSVDEVKALLEAIKAKAAPQDEFRVVYHVNTEEVVA